MQHVFWPNDQDLQYFKYKAAKRMGVERDTRFHFVDVETRERLGEVRLVMLFI